MGCRSSKDNVEAANSLGMPLSSGSTAKPDVGTTLKKDNQEDIRDKYELGKILGSGSFGQVREARLKDSTEVRAVKMIEPDKGDGEWSNQAIFVREVGLLQAVKHENIIRYYDFYEDIHFLYVVMELCHGGEVFAKIVEVRRFSEKNAASIGQQMLKALDYIHGLFIAHRDIKAENFMLSDVSIHSNVKMIDFGMATKFKPDQVLSELCGSPHYLSPELIGQKYNHMADVWAFGVLMYLLMYGHYPYDAPHPRDIMVKIITQPIKWQSKAKLSKEAIDFLTKLLEHDVKKRLNAAASLEHSWMRRVNSISDDGEILDTEVVRSAHRRITGTKKTLDPKIDDLRNKKLLKIDEDFSKGIRHGQRLGETPNEDYMSKPEFVRRENKITTAPSSDINKRRNSLSKMINAFVKHKQEPQTDLCISEEDENEDVDKPSGIVETKVHPKPMKTLGPPPNRGRSISLSMPPRRLSYLPGITKQDEKSFEELFIEERKRAVCLRQLSSQAIAVVPGEPDSGVVLPTLLPNSSPEEKDYA